MSQSRNGLSGSVRAEKTGHDARLDDEIQAVHRQLLSVPLTEAFYLDHRLFLLGRAGAPAPPTLWTPHHIDQAVTISPATYVARHIRDLPQRPMHDEPPIAPGATGILGKFFNDLPAGIHPSIRVLLDAPAGSRKPYPRRCT
jgi:hypothetical protein